MACRMRSLRALGHHDFLVIGHQPATTIQPGQRDLGQATTARARHLARWESPGDDPFGHLGEPYGPRNQQRLTRFKCRQ